MSWLGLLTPLYLLGLGALAAPILFHLIRRTPTGEVPFSSLMFLQPSPPRLTKRSRLDNLLLLLLRAAALSLLVFAFARPMLRTDAALDLTGVQSRRVALLVDTSASMRRGDLWQQTRQRIEQQLDQLEPQDQVALYTYDDRWQAIVEFDDSLPPLEEQREAILTAWESLRPTWRKTDLPQALMRTADHLLAGVSTADGAEPALQQLILISDLQPGTTLADLQGFEWPETLRLKVQPVTLDAPGNAAVRVLYAEEESSRSAVEEASIRRVRIANSPEADAEQLSVQYVGSDGRLTAGTSYFIPAGESRVVKTPRWTPPQSNVEVQPVAVRLLGDAAAFDNDFYLGTPRTQTMQVLHFGDVSADEPQSLPFFLKNALIDRPYRTFAYREAAPTADEPDPLTRAGATPDWVVVSGPVSDANRERIKRYVSGGGRLLVVVTAATQQPDLQGWLGSSVELGESDLEGYALLGEIDFSHPIFTPFADPRFSDFTSIRFWRHRELQDLPEDVRILARFDDGDPWLLESSLEEGMVYVLSSGWSTADSQLALSSKFLPIMAGLAGDQARRQQRLYYEVGETIRFADLDPTRPIEIEAPSGAGVELPAGEIVFRETDSPGRYRVRQGETEFTFAVNTAAAESDIEPIQTAELERFEIPLGEHPSRTEQVAWQRELQDRELEKRQKLWSWLLLATFGFLLAEMFLAGRIQRRQAAAWNTT